MMLRLLEEKLAQNILKRSRVEYDDDSRQYGVMLTRDYQEQCLVVVMYVFLIVQEEAYLLYNEVMAVLFRPSGGPQFRKSFSFLSR